MVGVSCGMPALSDDSLAAYPGFVRLQRVAHYDFFDLLGADPCPLQRGLDRLSAEVGSGDILERASEPAHGCPCSADDYGLLQFHGFLLDYLAILPSSYLLSDSSTSVTTPPCARRL